jgi:transcriptional regulator with XRE-family HTH domain
MKQSQEILANIRRIRIQRGISQAEIAAHLNMGPSNYRKMESGTSPLSLDRFIEICHYFKISHYDLLDHAIDHQEVAVIKANMLHYQEAMIDLKKNEEQLWSTIHKLLKIINPKDNDQAFKVVYSKK